MNNHFPCLFDSHAHYDHPRFKNNGPDIVRALRKDGLKKVVIPAITLESNSQVRNMFSEDEFPDVLFAVGIHPKVISKAPRLFRYTSSVEKYCADSRTVAIKTGLDYSNEELTTMHISQQKGALDILISMANFFELLLVFHFRDAFDESINILSKRNLHQSAVVHCFNAAYENFLAYKNVGVTHFGIGGEVTYETNSALRECVEKMPLENIVLETDAPFQKSPGWRETNNTSFALYQIAETIATIKGLSREDVLNETYRNACILYGLR